MADEGAVRFNHPQGSPDAMFRVLASNRALIEGKEEAAAKLATDALERDPSCVPARIALYAAFAGMSPEKERQDLLREGLRYSPGEADLVTALVESLVESNDIDLAAEVLEANRPLLIERGKSIVSHRLGEFLAVDRISRLGPSSSQATSLRNEWEWVKRLAPPLREWLRGANISFERSEDLSAAYGLYTGKAAEYILVERVMIPFRNSCRDAERLLSDRHRDISRFMGGGTAPSLGAIARLFSDTVRPHVFLQEEITRRFREAINRGMFGDPKVLCSKEFVTQLTELGRARNSTAHLGVNTLAELQKAAQFVVTNDRPGLLLKALRIA
jgi:hypothetical protein